jgi:hypothetical protein
MSDEKRCTACEALEGARRFYESLRPCEIHGTRGDDTSSEPVATDDFFGVAKSIVYPDRTPTPAEVVERLESLEMLTEWCDPATQTFSEDYYEVPAVDLEDAIATIKALEEDLRISQEGAGELYNRAKRRKRALEEIRDDEPPDDEDRWQTAAKYQAIAARALQTDHKILDNGSREEG